MLFRTLLRHLQLLSRVIDSYQAGLMPDNKLTRFPLCGRSNRSELANSSKVALSTWPSHLTHYADLRRVLSGFSRRTVWTKLTSDSHSMDDGWFFERLLQFNAPANFIRYPSKEFIDYLHCISFISVSLSPRTAKGSAGEYIDTYTKYSTFSIVAHFIRTILLGNPNSCISWRMNI